MAQQKRGFSIVRGVIGLAIAAGLAWAAQPTPATAETIYGLWTDSNGDPWCGGSCGKDQTCCSITPPPKMA